MVMGLSSMAGLELQLIDQSFYTDIENNTNCETELSRSKVLVDMAILKHGENPGFSC